MTSNSLTFFDLFGSTAEDRSRVDPYTREERRARGDRESSVPYISQDEVDALQTRCEERIIGRDLRRVYEKSDVNKYPVGVHAVSITCLEITGRTIIEEGNALYGVAAVGHLVRSITRFVRDNVRPTGRARSAWSELHTTLGAAELPLTRYAEEDEQSVLGAAAFKEIAEQACAGVTDSFWGWYCVRIGHMMISLLQKDTWPQFRGIKKLGKTKSQVYREMLVLPTPWCPVKTGRPFVVMANCKDFCYFESQGKSCFLLQSEVRNMASVLMAHGEMAIDIATGGRPMYGPGALETIMRGRDIIYGIQASRGNEAMNVVKMLEPLCTVIMMERHGVVQDEEFIANMMEGLREALDLPTVGHVPRSELMLFLRSMKSDMAAEFCYAGNTFGSCRGTEGPGFVKQQKRMVMEKSIVPVMNMKSTGGLMRDICRNYYRKHGRLPKMEHPNRPEFRVLGEYVSGQRADGLDGAVSDGFGLTTEQWYYVDIVSMFTYREADHMAASLEDKSIAPQRHRMEEVLADGTPKAFQKLGKVEKKCVLSWLTTSDFKEAYGFLSTQLSQGDMSVLEDECAKMSAKERELKIMCRFFTAYTKLFRHFLWNVRENFVALAPYIPGQLSHLSEALKEETISEFSDTPLSEDNFWVIFINLDFEAWNLYQTYLKTTPLLQKFDKLWDTELFQYLHVASRYLKYYFPGYTNVRAQDGANGLGEGQLQFIWTVDTLANVNAALAELGFTAVSTGSGDNCLGKIKLLKSVVTEQYGGDVSRAAADIKRKVCDVFNDLGRVTKSSESLASDVISILLKHLDVDGTSMPATLKYAAKRTSYASMGAPTLTASLGSLCGSLASVSEKGCTLLTSRHSILYNYVHTLQDLAVGDARQRVFKMPVTQFVALLIAGSELGGLPYIPARDVLCPGHSDGFTSRIGLAQMAALRVPSLEPYLTNLISTPAPSALEITDLARAPYAVPRVGTKSASSILKTFIEKAAKDYARGGEAKMYLEGISEGAKRTLEKILSSVTPRDPKMLNSIYEGSIVSLAEKLLSKVMTETTMSEAGSRKGLEETIRKMQRAVCSEIIEILERSLGAYKEGGKFPDATITSMWLRISPVRVARELRRTTWGIQEDTVTMVHPFDTFTASCHVSGIPLLRESNAILVTRESGLRYLTEGFHALYPRTLRGAYTRSKTSGKVKKGFTQHTVTSPAMKAIKTLLTAFSYTNRRSDSAAMAIIAVAKSFMSEIEFLTLATKVERTQGLVHHRLSVSGYKSEQHTNMHRGLVSYMHTSSDTIALLRETGNNYAINISHMLFCAKVGRTTQEIAHYTRTGHLHSEGFSVLYELDTSHYDSLTTVVYSPPPSKLLNMSPAGGTFFYHYELDLDMKSSVLQDLLLEQAVQFEAEEHEARLLQGEGGYEVPNAEGGVTTTELIATHNYLKVKTLLPKKTIAIPVEGAAGAAWVQEMFSTGAAKKVAKEYDINLSDLGALSAQDFPVYIAHYVASSLIIPHTEGDLSRQVVLRYIYDSKRAKEIISSFSSEVVHSPRPHLLLAPFQIISLIPYNPNSTRSIPVCETYIRMAIADTVLYLMESYQRLNIHSMPKPTNREERSALVAIGNMIFADINAQARNVARQYIHENREMIGIASTIVRIVEGLRQGDMEVQLQPIMLLVYKGLKASYIEDSTGVYFVDYQSSLNNIKAKVISDLWYAREQTLKGNTEYSWLLDLAEDLRGPSMEFLSDPETRVLVSPSSKLDDRRLLAYASYRLAHRGDLLFDDLEEGLRWAHEESYVSLEDVNTDRYRTLLKSARTLSKEDCEVMAVMPRHLQMQYLADHGNINPSSVSNRAREALALLDSLDRGEGEGDPDPSGSEILHKKWDLMDQGMLDLISPNMSTAGTLSEQQSHTSALIVTEPASLDYMYSTQFTSWCDFQVTGRSGLYRGFRKLVSPANMAKGGYSYSSTAAKLEGIIRGMGVLERPHTGEMRHIAYCLADGIGGFAAMAATLFPSCYVYVSALGGHDNVIQQEKSPLVIGLPLHIGSRIRRLGDITTKMDLRSPLTHAYLLEVHKLASLPCTLITMDAELPIKLGLPEYDCDLSLILGHTACFARRALCDTGTLIMKVPLDIGPSCIAVISMVASLYTFLKLVRPAASNLGNQEHYLIAWGRPNTYQQGLEGLELCLRNLWAKRNMRGTTPRLFLRQGNASYTAVHARIRQAQTNMALWEDSVCTDMDQVRKEYVRVAGLSYNGYIGLASPHAICPALVSGLLDGVGNPAYMEEGPESVDTYMDTVGEILETYITKYKNNVNQFKRAALRHSKMELNRDNLANQELVAACVRTYNTHINHLLAEGNIETVQEQVTRAGHTLPSGVCEEAYTILCFSVLIETYRSICALLTGEGERNPYVTPYEYVEGILGDACLDTNRHIDGNIVSVVHEEDIEEYTPDGSHLPSIRITLGPFVKKYGARWSRLYTLGVRLVGLRYAKQRLGANEGALMGVARPRTGMTDTVGALSELLEPEDVEHDEDRFSRNLIHYYAGQNLPHRRDDGDDEQEEFEPPGMEIAQNQGRNIHYTKGYMERKAREREQAGEFRDL